MKKFIINENDAGKRLDKFIIKAASGLSTSLMYKYIRKKSIKVNGKRAEISYKLAVDDVVEMYINDEFFEPKSNFFLDITYDPQLNIVYEDENLMLVDKKAGVIVHSDDKEQRDTLINQVLLYLYKKGEYDPEKETSFTPSLCNRLDKNTGGIVIVAKNAAAQRELYEIIKQRKITKKYLALVFGKPLKSEQTVTAYLKKDTASNTVTVRDKQFSDSKKIITKYKVIESNGSYSLIDVDLITGRTHQIRAHMAHIGHPLLGDCKYGKLKDNKSLPFRHQALYSYYLRFNIDDKDSMFYYLNNKPFVVNDIYFLDFLSSLKKVSKTKK